MCKKMMYLFSIVLVVGLAAGSANADIQSGLVGYWPLNEGAGDTTIDASGNGHDGTLHNGATWILPGYIGNAAVNIDGNPGSRVAIGTWDPGEQLTLAIWAKWTGEQNKAERTGLIGKRDSWSADGMKWFSEVTISGQIRMRNYTQTVSSPAGAMTALIDEWAHITITFDGTTVIIYLNGEEVGSGPFTLGPSETAAMGLGCKAGGSNSNQEIFSGDLDEARIYNRPLSVTDVQQLFEWTGIFGKAYSPKPADGQTDVPRDVALSWTPGEYAPPVNGHKVYVSDNFNEVNDGIGGITLDGSSYTPPVLLDFDTTYYWRVDEINGPPDNTVFEGNIWTFTTEPFAYAIENITATASSNDAGKVPENTVNGSGLDASGLLHGRDGESMWLSSLLGPQPAWIEYEFDNVYKLHEMWIWNFNDSLEPAIGFGLKDVTIEYSVNGIDYTTLGTTHEFARGPGMTDYAHNTTIDLSGVSAKYVRLTASSNWGGILDQYGLSEVRFFSIPVQAREPIPASGATDVDLDLVLSWRAGREAAKHEVYFSDDRQAVTDGTAPVTFVSYNSYGPLALDLGKTYYWRVDEINDAEMPATWQGEVWDFRTNEYFVVDDFEDYDAGDNQIWYAWKDGLGYGVQGTDPYYAGNGTGSAVGDENTGSYAEETIVHGGNQAMPLFYDNNKQGFFKYSETDLTLSYPRDWTAKGVKILTIWFRGNPAGLVEEPDGIYTMTASGADIWGTADEFRYAYKQLGGAGSITAKVESVENTDPWAKCGVMIRETLEPGSKFAAVYITPGNGCRFQGRLTPAADATSDTSVASAEQMAITAPYWIKLERDAAGNFNGYYSSDGISWQAMTWNPQKISMPANVYIGLALTSHSSGVTGKAEFSNVQTTGTVSPLTWTQEAIGVAMASNDPEPMYVALNGSAVVAHDNPDAAQTGDWTEWNINLQVFADQGVNLANVNTIALGLGDKKNPQPGGSGVMYFDDIRLYPSRP
jgi:hypothetical protein